MRTHYYVFGSICRGEIDQFSDIDLLACITGYEPEVSKDKFSIYNHARLEELWSEGNPFAWHLHLESRLVFSSDGKDFLTTLGAPKKYAKMVEDCTKFLKLFRESYQDLLKQSNNAVFNMSCMFLAMRNFATCFSLGVDQPIFSRKSPLLITSPLELSENIYDLFVRARILSTRGLGQNLCHDEIEEAMKSAPVIMDWMVKISLGLNDE